MKERKVKMDLNIETRYDSVRGCGWRKEGGLYLIAPEEGKACGKLPLPIGICPCCGGGIKVSRGFTWIDPVKLFGDLKCKGVDQYSTNEIQEVLGASSCRSCSLSTHGVNKMHNAGMIWIGEKFYQTPEDFLQEAAVQGVSRRINSIPHDFKLGKTWVFLAHRKGIPVHVPLAQDEQEWSPAIFKVFLPKAIEYVVHPDDDDDKLERLVKKGVTLVRIQRMNEQGEMIFKSDPTVLQRVIKRLSLINMMKGMTH